ncbi:hypothetical protein NJL88_29310 [Streptomyces sp. DK15]|uniref:hypothetical protein n=1 Tax=Streptomyces sp. DK15 TaxID=2957499 RepID=UPI0029B06645|nr:hypothetical protein [Streptomyces sp. DK15]MDX2394086.1 hypothetical protein [Streptomyces sp. DK15]
MSARDFTTAGYSRDMEAVRAAIDATAEARGPWVRDIGLLSDCLHALTARPPGTRRVGLDAILRLPRRPALIAEVLDRAGLGPQAERAEILRLARQVVALASSCTHCLAWKADGARLCLPCQRFKQAHHQVGACARCGRNLPLRQGRCRMCLYALAHIGERALTSGVQLWMDGAGLRPRWRGYRLVTGQDGIQRPVAAESTADRRQPWVSPAIATVWQLALFPAPPRHWEVLHQRELPALSDRAEALRRELAQLAARQQWRPRAASAHQRTLTMITAWLGVEAPIEEADLWAIARLGNSYNARRLIPFLTERGLLIPDHVRHADPHRAGVARLRRRIPAHLLPEVDVWIAVLRGEGRRPSRPSSWKTVNGYLGYATPLLESWGPAVTSLRETTTAHVQEAVDNASGVDGVFTALRSLFRALKRERVIFHDPARSVTFTFRFALRRPVPSDRLVGLIDRVPTASGKVAVALTAIHALRAQTIRGTLLSDLNRSKGTLGVRGTSGRQTRLVYLDDFTLSLIATMLKERAARWPHSTNPHLLVTRVTAHDPAGTQMSHKAFQYFFRCLGINAEQVRIDRILDEARATADPVHLMTVFGITEDTAMDYLASAHPERFPADPIAP